MERADLQNYMQTSARVYPTAQQRTRCFLVIYQFVTKQLHDTPEVEDPSALPGQHSFKAEHLSDLPKHGHALLS